MNRFSENRFIDAALKTVIVSALTHITIIVIHAIMTSNIMKLNYFKILELDLFIPGVGRDMMSFFVSMVTLLLVYFLVFYFMTHDVDSKGKI